MIFRFNGAAIEGFQSVLTCGARDWEHFEISGAHYLAVANLCTDATYKMESVIFRVNGAACEEFLSVPTVAPVAPEIAAFCGPWV